MLCKFDEADFKVIIKQFK